MNTYAFSGSRNGMSDEQFEALRNLLPIMGRIRVRHGDCKGADYTFNAGGSGSRTE